jgi:hypothetical protein
MWVLGGVFLLWDLVGVPLCNHSSKSGSDSWISSSKFSELFSVSIGVLLLLAMVCVKASLLDVEWAVRDKCACWVCVGVG